MAIKYVFVTGPPGSKWAGMSKWLSQSTTIVDSSDASPWRIDNPKNHSNHAHAFFGPYHECGERFDNLHLLTKEEIFAEIDRAHLNADADNCIRFCRSHWFAYQLDWIKENLPEIDILLVTRSPQICFDWWFEAGGWHIQYPTYKWYGTEENMWRQINVELRCIAEFSKKNNITWQKGINTENWLTRNWPEMINYIKDPPYEIDELTVSAALYKGKESVPLQQISSR